MANSNDPDLQHFFSLFIIKIEKMKEIKNRYLINAKYITQLLYTKKKEKEKSLNENIFMYICISELDESYLTASVFFFIYIIFIHSILINVTVALNSEY